MKHSRWSCVICFCYLPCKVTKHKQTSCFCGGLSVLLTSARNVFKRECKKVKYKQGTVMKCVIKLSQNIHVQYRTFYGKNNYIICMKLLKLMFFHLFFLLCSKKTVTMMSSDIRQDFGIFIVSYCSVTFVLWLSINSVVPFASVLTPSFTIRALVVGTGGSQFESQLGSLCIRFACLSCFLSTTVLKHSRQVDLWL